MTHYQDILLKPDEMAEETVLMNLLFGRLHKALASLGSSDVGVSFPDVGRTLGSILRLHGSKDALSRLDGLSWPGPLKDHIHKGNIAPVPDEVQGYRTVSRKQFKSSPERLRRRLVKRHNLSPAEAVTKIPDTLVAMSDLPFIQLKSSSTGQRFRLFVDHGTLRQKPCIGKFSHYGLSPEATIPWF